jgi:hypothetical protein
MHCFPEELLQERTIARLSLIITQVEGGQGKDQHVLGHSLRILMKSRLLERDGTGTADDLTQIWHGLFYW